MAMVRNTSTSERTSSRVAPVTATGLDISALMLTVPHAAASRFPGAGGDRNAPPAANEPSRFGAANQAVGSPGAGPTLSQASAANPKFAHLVRQAGLRTSGSKAALES